MRPLCSVVRLVITLMRCRIEGLHSIAKGGGRGSNDVLPFMSLVGRELASRTGPCQVRSKKTLTVMFAGDVEKVLVDGLM